MRAPVLLLLAATAACDGRQNLVAPDFDLNRMIDQPRYDPWEASGFFADGKVMQAPPDGTLPIGAAQGSPGLVLGVENGMPVAKIPIPITMELLQTGQRRFGTYCSPCHGVDGYAQTVVAENMKLVRPPSFHQQRLREAPPGHIYSVILEGFGMMPHYSYQLGVEERWAVVAYLRALQNSQQVSLDTLPPELRSRALEELGR